MWRLKLDNQLNFTIKEMEPVGELHIEINGRVALFVDDEGTIFGQGNLEAIHKVEFDFNETN